MEIRTRLCVSVDGCVTTEDGRPVQLADPRFSPQAHGFVEFQGTLDAVLMGRTTFEPALTADRWPWPNLDVFVLGSHRPDGTPAEVVVDSDPVGGQNSSLPGRAGGYASPMSEFLILLIRALASLFRHRAALIVENLLLRQQLQVALPP